MSNRAAPTFQALLAHTRWVENLARSLVRDPDAAADLAQSTLLVALERKAPARNLRAWLARVMRNQARERFRREASRPSIESRGAQDERLPGADELVQRAECERRLVAAVLALEEPHRSTLLLRYFEELSPEEIARRSNAPLSTISSRITRAHAQLRASLGEQDPRTNWIVALTPILVRTPMDILRPIHPVPSNTQRLLLMSTTSKVLIVLVLGAAALWFALPERESKPTDSAALTTQPADAAPSTPDSAPSESSGASSSVEERQPVLAVKEPEAKKSEAIVAAPAAGGRIYGQIFRPDGRAASQRKIRMLRSNTGPEKYVTTDDEGRFDERELGAGTWSLSTWPDKAELEALGKSEERTFEGFTYMTQRTVDLEVGGEIEVILGKAPVAGVHASGRILHDQASLEGYMTWLPDGRDSMDLQKIATASEAKGYEVLLDTPGRYLVIAIYGEARVEFVVDVPAGPEFARDFVLPATTLRGRITRMDGAPVVGARVDLTPRSGLNPRHPAANITYSHPSSADGVFTFSNIPPARYAVGVHGGSVGENKEPAAARALRDIEVSVGSDAAPLEIVLAAGATIQGIIRAESGSIAFADVFVIDAEGEPLNPLQGVASKKDGTFELFALAPGSYRAVAASGALWSDVVPFDVPMPADRPTLKLELKPCATLTIDIDGHQPAWIDLRDSSAVCISALFDKHVFNRTVNRDWSSSAFVYRVPPGEYRVAVVGAAGRLAEQKIVALAGESLTVDLRRH